MAARILKLPAERLRRRDAGLETSNGLARHAERIHFWRGASGRSYSHIVYGLLDCPAVPAATYVMVRRDGKGAARALRVGRVKHAAETLNLADLRRIGATLGASEIHLHFLADAELDGLSIELDLKAASQHDAPERASHRASH